MKETYFEVDSEVHNICDIAGNGIARWMCENNVQRATVHVTAEDETWSVERERILRHKINLFCYPFKVPVDSTKVFFPS